MLLRVHFLDHVMFDARTCPLTCLNASYDPRIGGLAIWVLLVMRLGFQTPHHLLKLGNMNVCITRAAMTMTRIIKGVTITRDRFKITCLCNQLFSWLDPTWIHS